MPAPEPDPRERRDALLLAGATLALLAPFLTKAPHIDDPLFLLAAEQIRKAPLDFFGTSVNWYGQERPFHEVTQNPPGASYLLALLGPLGGIVAMHAGFAFAAVAAVLGVRALAKDLGAPSLAAGFLALAMPVFLVSATTLMSDVPMTALFTWAVVLWLRGLERERAATLVLASCLAGLAVLTKYFAVALLPLFVLAALVRRSPVRLWLPALLPAAAMIAGYEAATRSLYAKGHFLAAFSYASEIGGKVPAGDRLLQGVVFAGGCVFPLLAVAHLLLGKRAAAAWLLAAACLTGLVLWRGQLGIWTLDVRGEFRTVMFAWSVIYGAAAALAVAVAVQAVRADRSAGTVVLVAWAAGTFVFAALVNWTMNGRSVLPLVPAVAVLAARALRGGTAARVLAIAPGVVIGLVVAHGDFRLAAAGPLVAEAARTTADVPPDRIWFQGHWGLQTAMEGIGARPLAFGRSPVRRGDLIVVPHYAANVRPFPEGWADHLSTFEVPVGAFAATMSPPAACGFYSTILGPLPFRLGPAPPEVYSTFRAAIDFPLDPSPR